LVGTLDKLIPFSEIYIQTWMESQEIMGSESGARVKVEVSDVISDMKRADVDFI